MAAVQHPTYVVSLIGRLVALATVLTLGVGNLAVCAGWQATPEARMACCMNGPSCPMHKADAHYSESKRVLSQTQADDCCAAASNRHDSAAPNASFASSGALVLIPVAMALPAPQPVPALQGWRALVPLPVSPVPKHLLLSVLLV
jgi:hypothetical protein